MTFFFFFNQLALISLDSLKKMCSFDGDDDNLLNYDYDVVVEQQLQQHVMMLENLKNDEIINFKIIK